MILLIVDSQKGNKIDVIVKQNGFKAHITDR